MSEKPQWHLDVETAQQECRVCFDKWQDTHDSNPKDSRGTRGICAGCVQSLDSGGHA